MKDLFLLHTHTVMSLLLLLFVSGMFIYINNLKTDTLITKWFRYFFLGEVLWQSSDVLRYSLHPGMIGSIFYKLEVSFWTIPALCLLEISYLQFLYLFLGNPFEKERKIVKMVMYIVSGIVCILIFWNEFLNKSDVNTLNFIGFSFGFLTNAWIMTVCFRKAIFFKKNNQKKQAQGIFYMGLVNTTFVTACILALAFGFYSTVGYWSFFSLIWFGNLANVVLYINYGAVPTGFQTKLMGFTFVIVMTVLMLVTLFFYPLLPPTEITISATQQLGLTKLIVIILFSMAIIVLVLPRILSYTLTEPLHRLLIGVQKVNDGDYTSKLEVGQPDEIGTLTTNFNQMTASLKQSKDELILYAATLEEKVNERTNQLQNSLDALKNTQAQLIQSEKMASLGELTAGIAHEIQNPLNFVNNFSEVSSEIIDEMNHAFDKRDFDEARSISLDLKQNLIKINQHGQRASSIVNGMLEHSRKSSGEKELTNLNNLTDEYLRLSYHGLLAKEKSFNATMKTDFDESIGNINIIPQDIGRVLLNLYSNAFCAVNEKKKTAGSGYEPTVSVSTKKDGGKVFISVKDNGNGIPQKAINKIFQPFFTTKPTGQGTGLGLSLSYDIVKAHGGEIKVETKEGEGSEFEIQLPIV
jgi:two-component system NtrC family sensor kinase